MMSVFVPEQYGGSGFGYFEYVTVIEEIAKVCGSIGLSVAAHNSLVHRAYPGFWQRGTKTTLAAQTGHCEWLGAWGLNRSQHRLGCHGHEHHRRFGWRPLYS